MLGAFFAGSPSITASVFESNNSVTLTFYSIPPEALGANFKKIKLFCVVGLHGFWRCGIFFLSLRFIEVSWIFGLFFDDHHTGGLEKTRKSLGVFPTRVGMAQQLNESRLSRILSSVPHESGDCPASARGTFTRLNARSISYLTPMGLKQAPLP